MVVKYEVDPDRKFQKAIEAAIRDVDDLTIPFTLITKSWFQSNKFIFALKSPGKYEDLSEKYKIFKQKRAGFVYPILRGLTGDLEKSITEPGGDSIVEIINKKTLVLGSKDKKAKYHQFGTKRMPARPVVIYGAEQTAPPDMNRRLDLWVETIKNYCLERAKQRVGSGTP